MDLPWIVIGDFNEIMYSHEKGGNSGPANMMQAFRDCLMDCDLHDMGLTGGVYIEKGGNWTKIRPSCV
jgi:hypothetical protein